MTALNRNPGAPSGMVDFAVADTTPGARCVLAPPAGDDLTDDQYLALMRKRYRQDIHCLVHLWFFARHVNETEFVGPYAEQAKAILRKVSVTHEAT